MIERYSRAAMRRLWSDEERYRRWLDVEIRVLEALSAEGMVPGGVVEAVRSRAKVQPERVAEIENEVKHDVIAFLTAVSEVVGSESRFVHRGMTSNDLLDTTFATLLRDAGRLIVEEINQFLATLHQRAQEFMYVPCIGRSHGVHAEPTTFGLKVASWYAELARRRDHLVRGIAAIAVGKIAGAVGTYASIPPKVEARVLAELGLQPEVVPSQIVHRDRHAEYFTSLALLGSSLERIAVEIRHLQRTEVREVEEGFAPGQKGSSAMPHKKNPIGSENVSGLARLLRSYALAALENVALWHERDISHSSVERVIAPDACLVADYAVARLHSIVKNLVVFPDRMRANLELTRGLIFSGTLLIALVDAGMSREEAYRIVQEHALATWKEGLGASFQERVTADGRITARLSPRELSDVFDLQRHLREVATIADRVFGVSADEVRC